MEIASEEDNEAVLEEQCTIEVQVQDSSDSINPELLQMYFENPKSGGTEDCVQNVEILSHDIAHVTFHTPEGMCTDSF